MKRIDIHAHGIGGYDTRTADPDQVLHIAEIHGSYGVSEILLTVYPAAIRIMRENMDTIRQAMKKQKNISRPVRGGDEPSRIMGIHLEGPFLNPAQCGALNAMTFLEPTEYNCRELIEGFEDIVKIITIAPEMNGALTSIRKISDMGVIVSMGHSDATYEEAEAGFRAGAKGITHIFNAMRTLHHREPGIAGFGLLNKEIYIEVIADPFHLHPKTLELIFRTKDRDRIIIISDAVKETKIRSGEGMAISDTRGSLLGGSLTIVESSNRLISTGYDEEVIEGFITTNPAAYLSAG